jgi:hypothetical protein
MEVSVSASCFPKALIITSNPIYHDGLDSIVKKKNEGNFGVIAESCFPESNSLAKHLDE